MTTLATNRILRITLISSALLFTACTSSSLHPYNEAYGVVPNPEVDQILAETDKQQFLPPTESVEVEDSNNGMVVDPEAVTAENYVQKPTEYSYKYDFDPNFYEEAIWRKQ